LSSCNTYGNAGSFPGRADGERAAAAGVLGSLIVHLLAAACLMLLWGVSGGVRPADIITVELAQPGPVKARTPKPKGEPAATAATPRPPVPVRQTLPVPEKATDVQEVSDDVCKTENIQDDAVPLRKVMEDDTRRGEKAPEAPDVRIPAGFREGESAHDRETVALNAPERPSTGNTGACCGPDVELGTMKEDYARKLKEMIERYVDYPMFARRARIEGTCMLICRINAAGELLDVFVAKSTGADLLDKAALDAVRDAGRFPPVPYVEDGVELDVSVPVNFSLNGR